MFPFGELIFNDRNIIMQKSVIATIRNKGFLIFHQWIWQEELCFSGG